MREAVATARELRARDAEWHRNRWSAEIRYGQPHPPLVVRNWREAMAEGLRQVWREARECRAPAPEATLAETELAILTIHCAERITRPERDRLNVLQARLVELRSPNRATVAHV